MLTNKYKVPKAKRTQVVMAKQQFRRINKYLRNIVLAGLLLFLTMLVGVIGFIVIEDYSVGDAFYMTIITLSTVGYGEVQPLHAYGRVFTSFLIIFNIGIFAYAISVLSSFVIEGDLRKFLKDYTIFKRIQKLKNHTIICGFGRHGKEIADELTKNKMPFVVIEPEEQRLQMLREGGYSFVEGDATSDQTLLEAGIEDARAIVITFGEDAFNVYTVLTARQLSPKLRIITRASDHSVEKKLFRAGADYVVLSEVIGGFYMATLIFQPHVVEFFNLLSNMGDDVAINFKEVEYLELKPEFRDKAIKNIGIRAQTGVNIIGARMPDAKYIVNPAPNTLIKKGMSLVVLGDHEQIDKFEDLILLAEH
jgi:voltage-gated potassium channel